MLNILQKSKTLLFMLAATLKPIRLECYLPRMSGANKVSQFRADILARYWLQWAKDSSVFAMDKMVVGLNVATRSCNVYLDKCWFAVLCRFWLQCSRNLIQLHSGTTNRMQKTFTNISVPNYLCQYIITRQAYIT